MTLGLQRFAAVVETEKDIVSFTRPFQLPSS